MWHKSAIKMLCNNWPPQIILNFVNFRVKLSWKVIRIGERIYTPGRKMLKRMNTAMSIQILINNKWRHNNRNMWSQNNKGIQTNWEVNHRNCFYILFYEDCPLMWKLKKGDNLWFCVHDALHKCALRRFPYEIRRFQFVIDRHHQANHTACSEAYSMSCYPYMNNMNIQLAEQLNNSLRKLSTVTAYSKVNTYIKILEAFITVKNLCVKKNNLKDYFQPQNCSNNG